MEQLDEPQLLYLLASNLDGAFEQLVISYQDRLYAFALTHVHNPHAAEEIVLLALERAYYALKGYPPERILLLRLASWLFEITRNLYKNYLRDTQTRADRLPSIPLPTQQTDPLLDIEDQSMTPEELACRNEEQQALRKGIAQLPQNYQTAVQLYYFEHLTTREVAERTRQPIGTVKSQLHRSTKLLYQILYTPTREVY
ncbi:RNA polymerase sigma factor [Dictyobacter arantiisoli]|uniref:RNA polymerase sigma factor n=1 Tax=Dictyobacter arantiisoli TaxID=2014874 RepID=A0A5A5T6H9_9CHLR|nr:sigma-70 family RNA polymerase sigma factor [Dictyobacter arantiisoli]GCF06623.1 RNA polymerase sigma factor [Dictyobacter arantiisoli]